MAPIRPILLTLAGVLVVSISAHADNSDWMASVFPDRSHNFGNVARGSQIRYAFPVVNRSSNEVHIADWRTKCGCTNVKVGARAIPPGTQTTIEATIDTTRFHGRKDSGLTLVLDRPTYAEIDLNMTCFIRGDVNMSPGQIDFGLVKRTEKLPSTTLTLTYLGGRAGWEIAEMKTQSALVRAVAERIGPAAGGVARWSISATLQPGITNGYFKDEISLITNDTPPQTIPISVIANVRSAVTATPSIINFGSIVTGQSVSKSVLVRSSAPFAISKTEANAPELSAAESEAGSKPAHSVNITVRASASPGPLYGIVKIASDVKDEPPTQVKVFATIVKGQ